MNTGSSYPQTSSPCVTCFSRSTALINRFQISAKCKVNNKILTTDSKTWEHLDMQCPQLSEFIHKQDWKKYSLFLRTTQHFGQPTSTFWDDASWDLILTTRIKHILIWGNQVLGCAWPSIQNLKTLNQIQMIHHHTKQIATKSHILLHSNIHNISYLSLSNLVWIFSPLRCSS